MINLEEKKEKIISFLKDNGPSLPVRIAKVIEMDPIFTNAILSELVDEKKIIASNMRVGSSPYYLLENQKKELINMIDNLKGVEREALNKLMKEGVLEDEKLEPAIRIALRSLKDFALSYTRDGKIFWRYAFLKGGERKAVKPEEPHKKIDEKINVFEHKKDFYNDVKKYLEENEIKIKEEIQSDKKEVVAKILVPSKIGEIEFLLVAKNKKTTTRDEVNSLLQLSNYHQMPLLYVLRKKPAKSISNFVKGNHLIVIRDLG